MISTGSTEACSSRSSISSNQWLRRTNHTRYASDFPSMNEATCEMDFLRTSYTGGVRTAWLGGVCGDER